MGGRQFCELLGFLHLFICYSCGDTAVALNVLNVEELRASVEGMFLVRHVAWRTKPLLGTHPWLFFDCVLVPRGYFWGPGSSHRSPSWWHHVFDLFRIDFDLCGSGTGRVELWRHSYTGTALLCPKWRLSNDVWTRFVFEYKNNESKPLFIDLFMPHLFIQIFFRAPLFAWLSPGSKMNRIWSFYLPEWIDEIKILLDPGWVAVFCA